MHSLSGVAYCYYLMLLPEARKVQFILYLWKNPWSWFWGFHKIGVPKNHWFRVLNWPWIGRMITWVPSPQENPLYGNDISREAHTIPNIIGIYEGFHKWGWFIMENSSINGWFGGTPPFQETSIWQLSQLCVIQQRIAGFMFHSCRLSKLTPTVCQVLMPVGAGLAPKKTTNLSKFGTNPSKNGIKNVTSYD